MELAASQATQTLSLKTSNDLGSECIKKVGGAGSASVGGKE